MNRVIALIVDLIIVSFISGLVVTNPEIEKTTIDYQPISAVYSLKLLLVFGYFLFFDITNKGETIGKAFFNNSIYKSNLGKRVVRTSYKMISILLFPFTILLYLFKGVILHDYLFDKILAG